MTIMTATSAFNHEILDLINAAKPPTIPHPVGCCMRDSVMVVVTDFWNLGDGRPCRRGDWLQSNR